MTRATRRTQTWVAEHSAEELADAVAPFYRDVSRDILASSLRRYRDAELWARTPEVSRQGFARLADSLKSGGFIYATHATRTAWIKACASAASFRRQEARCSISSFAAATW